MENTARRHAQLGKDTAHPFSITAGQIVIHGHHVHAVAGQCIEVGGQGGDQGLTFTGFHLCDLTLVENHPAEELHIIVALAQGPFSRLADGCKGFG